MARKTLNRKELREEHDAAERAEDEDREDDAEGEEEEEEKAKPAKEAKAAKPKRKSRAKVEKKLRLKAYWGVLNQSLKKIAQFEYHERSAAQKKAEDLSTSQKSPHFVRLIKEEIS